MDVSHVLTNSAFSSLSAGRRDGDWHMVSSPCRRPSWSRPFSDVQPAPLTRGFPPCHWRYVTHKVTGCKRDLRFCLRFSCCAVNILIYTEWGRKRHCMTSQDSMNERVKGSAYSHTLMPHVRSTSMGYTRTGSWDMAEWSVAE